MFSVSTFSPGDSAIGALPLVLCRVPAIFLSHARPQRKGSVGAGRGRSVPDINSPSWDPNPAGAPLSALRAAEIERTAGAGRVPVCTATTRDGTGPARAGQTRRYSTDGTVRSPPGTAGRSAKRSRTPQGATKPSAGRFQARRL